MRRARGFTLVELLVALFALALLAALSWRGLDGMMRTRQITEERADQVLALQTGLAQWQADLDAIASFPPQTAIEWNGRVLRLTRLGSQSPADGVRVVGWTRREGQWRRWQSPVVINRGDLEAAWTQADLWAQNPSDVMRAQEVAITPLADWQIFFFRENAWTNPQSADTTTATPTTSTATTGTTTTATTATTTATATTLPDGIRIVLQLPEGRAISGQLQRDWMRPTLTP
jgi:general secretion pathway protein J